MSLDVGDARVLEHAPDEGVGVAALHEVGVHHHVVRIEGAQAKRTRAQRIREVVDAFVRFDGALADEDRVARAVRRVCRLVNVVDEQGRLADLQVAEFDAIGEARLCVDDVSLRAVRGEGRVVEGEEVSEGAAGRPVTR